MDNPTILGVIDKNSREVIVIRRGMIGPHDCIDFRVYTRGLDGQPEFPKKKGIAFRAEIFPEVYEVVREVNDELRSLREVRSRDA